MEYKRLPQGRARLVAETKERRLRESILEPDTRAGLAARVKALVGDNTVAAAKRTGVSQSAIHKLADGKTLAPYLGTVARIARAYSRSIDWLLWGDEAVEGQRDFRDFPHSRVDQLYRNMMHPAAVRVFGGRVSVQERHEAIIAVAREERYSREELAELHDRIAASLRLDEGGDVA